MNLFETTALGIVQGLTEFLPVSSSGHLVILEHLLGLDSPELLLNISLHMGTLVAVCVFFRTEITKIAREALSLRFRGPHGSMAVWVIAGSVPTAIIGLLFKAPLERLFSSLWAVGALLIVTGLVLFATRLIPRPNMEKHNLSLFTALAVGTAQGLAIAPGISRSGATIACALFCGLGREVAGRFSFLLAIPAIVGALVIEFDWDSVARVGAVPLISGFFVAGAVGFFSLKLLISMVREGHLHYFAPYCWAVGLVLLIL